MGEPGPGVRRVPGGDLGLDEGAEELLGRPPLGFGGEEQLGGEAAHGSQPEPPETGLEVTGKWGGRGGHAGSPMA